MGQLNNAGALFLNVTPLLPVEITALFDARGIPPKVLPRMLISPQYWAQQSQEFLFEALFGITERMASSSRARSTCCSTLASSPDKPVAATITVRPRSRIWTGT